MSDVGCRLSVIDSRSVGRWPRHTVVTAEFHFAVDTFFLVRTTRRFNRLVVNTVVVLHAIAPNTESNRTCKSPIHESAHQAIAVQWQYRAGHIYTYRHRGLMSFGRLKRRQKTSIRRGKTRGKIFIREKGATVFRRVYALDERDIDIYYYQIC